MDAVAGRHGFAVDWRSCNLGGKHYLQTGEVLPDAGAGRVAQQSDAILLGAVGTPDVPPGVLERGLLLRLRFELDLYVNLRPSKLRPGVGGAVGKHQLSDLDFVIVRENTEGLYAGAGGSVHKGTEFETATEESLNTWVGVRRCVKYAAQLAARRSGRLTLVHKTNVLTNAGDLWYRVAREVAAEEGVQLSYAHVDAACLWMVDDPARFDVIVTDNLFGDIISDLGAALTGGLGYSPSGNLNPDKTGPSVFEPVHGSAPDIAGKGLANPAGAVLSAGLMLDHLGEEAAARGTGRGGERGTGRWRAGYHRGVGEGAAAPTYRRGDVMVTPKVEIYDTTLRDGSQQVGLDLTVTDKLRVATALDALGVDVIEGGWPGSNPKDAEFFERVKEMRFRHAALAAFGATRLPGRNVEDDASLAALLAADTPIVTLVGKSWTLHVDEALRTTRAENVAMVADSVAYMAAHGRRVVFDAEHFFDGYFADRGYALEVLAAAAEAGADTLCAVRHQRRHAARRRVPDRDGGRRPVAHRDRRALPQRLGLRGSELCRRGRGGRPARAGRGQRLRRAVRQRRPVLGHRRPGAQARPRAAAGRPAVGAGHHRADHCRGSQPAVRRQAAVRRLVGVRHQGRVARLGDRAAAGRLLARRPGHRRQQGAGPGQ